MKLNQLVPQCNGFIARWVLLKITFLKCVLIQVIKDCMLEAATASVFDGGQCQSAINDKFLGAVSIFRLQAWMFCIVPANIVAGVPMAIPRVAMKIKKEKGQSRLVLIQAKMKILQTKKRERLKGILEPPFARRVLRSN